MTTSWERADDEPFPQFNQPPTEVPIDIVVEGTVLPPAPGVCATCAVDHTADQPHNAQSLYYQYAFYHDNMRWPNWGDAMAHCAQDVQDFWRDRLVGLGVEHDRLWAPGQLPPGDPS